MNYLEPQGNKGLSKTKKYGIVFMAGAGAVIILPIILAGVIHTIIVIAMVIAVLTIVYKVGRALG